MKKQIKLSWVTYSIISFSFFLIFYLFHDRKREGYIDSIKDTLCKDSILKDSISKLEAAAAAAEYARREADSAKTTKN